MRLRDKKSIIIGMFVALIIFIIFVITITTYVYPQIMKIEEGKKLYGDKIEEFEKLKYEGIDYETFNKLKDVYQNDENIQNKMSGDSYKNMMKKLDLNFFNKTLSGSVKDNSLFLDNINKIAEEIEIKKNSYFYQKQKNDLTNILPKYSNFIDSNDYLTNFKFINYVENLLHKYSIITKDNIGIKDVVAVKDTNNIYYIPLKLNITVNKDNFIKFLKEINDSGKTVLNADKIEIKNNKHLSEVTRIGLKTYFIDDIRERTSTESLEEFLKDTNQLQDIIKADIELRFYVNGVGKDVILKDINKVIGNEKVELVYDEDGNIVQENGKNKYKLVNYNYTNLLAIAKKLQKNTKINKNTYFKNKVQKIYSYLTDPSLKKDMLGIKKEIKKAKELDSIYKKVLKYKEIFNSLDRELYGIIKALGLADDKKDKDGNKYSSVLPNTYIPQEK